MGLCGVHDLSVTLSEGFSGGMYGIYLISGYLVKKDFFKRFKSSHLMIAALLSVAVLVLIQLFAYKYNVEFKLWYDSIFILISGVSLFELTSRIDDIRFYDAILFLSRYSFAVFLVHNLFRLPLYPYFSGLVFNYPFKLILFALAVIILSYMLSFAISKIPKIGKYVLYLK